MSKKEGGEGEGEEAGYRDDDGVAEVNVVVVCDEYTSGREAIRTIVNLLNVSRSPRVLGKLASSRAASKLLINVFLDRPSAYVASLVHLNTELQREARERPTPEGSSEFASSDETDRNYDDDYDDKDDNYDDDDDDDDDYDDDDYDDDDDDDDDGDDRYVRRGSKQKVRKARRSIVRARGYLRVYALDRDESETRRTSSGGKPAKRETIVRPNARPRDIAHPFLVRQFGAPRREAKKRVDDARKERPTNTAPLESLVISDIEDFEKIDPSEDAPRGTIRRERSNLDSGLPEPMGASSIEESHESGARFALCCVAGTVFDCDELFRLFERSEERDGIYFSACVDLCDAPDSKSKRRPESSQRNEGVKRRSTASSDVPRSQKSSSSSSRYAVASWMKAIWFVLCTLPKYVWYQLVMCTCVFCNLRPDLFYCGEIVTIEPDVPSTASWSKRHAAGKRRRSSDPAPCRSYRFPVPNRDVLDRYVRGEYFHDATANSVSVFGRKFFDRQLNDVYSKWKGSWMWLFYVVFFQGHLMSIYAEDGGGGGGGGADHRSMRWSPMWVAFWGAHWALVLGSWFSMKRIAVVYGDHRVTTARIRLFKHAVDAALAFFFPYCIFPMYVLMWLRRKMYGLFEGPFKTCGFSFGNAWRRLKLSLGYGNDDGWKGKRGRDRRMHRDRVRSRIDYYV